MKKAILVVSFGSSYKEAREKAIEPVEEAIEKAFPAFHIERAYTSFRIIAKLKKQGIVYQTPKEALEKLVALGYKEIYVQPLHIIPGFEYDKIKEMINEMNHRDTVIHLSQPLLYRSEDYEHVVEALKAQCPLLKKDQIVVLVGHGTEHKANACYETLKMKLKEEQLPFLVGTIEHGLADVVKDLKENHYDSVILMPFLLVAGDHALNDLMGDKEDSWKNQLTNLGFEVEGFMKGLGENKMVRQIYIQYVHRLIQR